MSFLSRYASLGETVDTSILPKPALRINTLYVDAQKAVARLQKKGVTLDKIPGVPGGYWYDAPFSLGATPEFLQGWYYLQEAASQLPVLALDPRPGELVLDMAAAPGSKTTQLAQFMKNKGVIVALDDNSIRLQSLKNNLERMHVAIAACYKKDARFTDDLKMVFDKVLLDAPCSGNYCVEKNYFTTRTLQGVKERARLQKELLKAAYKVLKKGGTLVYSTCSLEPEEDEFVVDWFLSKYADMQLVPLSLSLGSPGLTTIFEKEVDKTITLTRKLWPHKDGTQGFFIAKLVKQ